jgi:ubiquitin-conjugating enzyme E2 S
VPFPESSLNEEAGKLFMENYQGYYTHAKMFTDIYAKNQQIEEEKK